MTRMIKCSLVAAALCAVSVATADVRWTVPYNPDCDKYGGEVNISGATLFAGFFPVPASTNDFGPNDADCDGAPATEKDRAADQLARNYYIGYGGNVNFPNNDWWLVQYRGVGSGNGLAEFVTFNCYGDVPTGTPADLGYINRTAWYDGDADPSEIPHGLGAEYNGWDLLGACCYDNGEEMVCEKMVEADCTALSGTFLGVMTTCNPYPCDQDPAVTLGACTYTEEEEEVCERLTQNDCTSLGGTFAGFGTQCSECLDSNTPICPSSIDLAVMDVPTTWFTISPGGTPGWRVNPAEPGYGNCPITTLAGQSNKLKSLGCLNPYRPSVTPDELTVFDTPIAHVPIGFIANRGAGIGLNNGDRAEGQIKVTELQHLFLTGRLPSGENLVVCTRDSGSGTRNGAMNSIDIDPSWGVGDNIGKKAKDSESELLGPQFQQSNRGGSSRMEGAVQNSRLAIGYTGVIGSSRCEVDAESGKYEICHIQFDNIGICVCLDGSAFYSTEYECEAPCTWYGAKRYVPDPFDPFVELPEPFDPNGPLVVDAEYTQPQKYNVLHNGFSNPAAYQISGPETFASLGDPLANAGMSSNPPMSNQAAADYLNNITMSIAAFVDAPGDVETNGTPGEFLATQYVLLAATDYAPSANPGVFEVNPAYNTAVQNYIMTYNANMSVPAYGDDDFGTNRPANRVPARATPSDYDIVWPSTKNSCDCAYPADGTYSDGSNGSAYTDAWGNTWTAGSTLNARNRIAGDFNGDGLRNIDDIAGMMECLVDEATKNAYVMANSTESDPLIPEIIGDYNGDGNFDCRDARYFADGLAVDPMTGKLNRLAGFIAIDLAWGDLTGDYNYFNVSAVDCSYTVGMAALDVAGNDARPGAQPTGYDCVVDETDRAYIEANFGDWADVDSAITIDLSADMNGDLVIDAKDLNAYDLKLKGDCNCDGKVDFADINAFVDALGGPVEGCAAGADVDCNGAIEFADINPFVAALSNGY